MPIFRSRTFATETNPTKRFALALALLLSLFLLPRPAAAGNFAHNYGGATGARATTLGSAVDAAGNEYISGNFNSSTLTLGSVTLTRMGNQDAFVAKLDASGTVQWARNFGGSGANTTGAAIAVDGSGNVYLGGNFTTANLTTPALTKIGLTDAFALKLDSSGTTTWARNFGGSGSSLAGNAIAVDGSGNVYLGGLFNGTDPTTPAMTRIGNLDGFAIKVDSGGATMWATNFGGIGATSYVKAIAVDGSGNVHLGGYFRFANLTTPALTKIGVYDAFLIKLDSAGATTWARNFGGAGAYAYGQAIAVDGSSNVYLDGTFSNANLTTPALTKIGSTDTFAIKLDSTGATTWAKNFGGAGGSAAVAAIAVDNSNNVYLGGTFSNANLTTPALTKIGLVDTFAVKLDSTGSTTWAKDFGGSGAAEAYVQAIAVDGSNNVYLGGYFASANLTAPALTKIGFIDALTLKLDSAGTTTWARNYGGLTEGSASINAAAVDASGNEYISGHFDTVTYTLGGVTLTRIGAQDSFVAKLDVSGNVVWARNFGGSGATAFGYAIAVDGSGNVYLGGYFYNGSLTTPALTRIGIWDAYAIKLDSAGTTTWGKNFGGSGAAVQGLAIAVDESSNVYLGGQLPNTQTSRRLR